ncbi:MAG: GNAT family N-acetyltransferase [Oscillospiraceae bacterium]|nr:GNAT family N-acetyltransferase [Oscillospiraceae bacterium]
MAFTVKVLLGSEDLSDAFRLRQRVFTDEQGYPADIDVDENDARAFHAVVYHDLKPVATARAFQSETDGEYRFGRVCNLKEYRKRGLARLMLHTLELVVRQNGGRSVVLHSQTQAQGFYEKCGYTAEGDVYMEDGGPHITMRKSL